MISTHLHDRLAKQLFKQSSTTHRKRRGLHKCHCRFRCYEEIRSTELCLQDQVHCIREGGATTLSVSLRLFLISQHRRLVRRATPVRSTCAATAILPATVRTLGTSSRLSIKSAPTYVCIKLVRRVNVATFSRRAHGKWVFLDNNGTKRATLNIYNAEIGAACRERLHEECLSNGRPPHDKRKHSPFLVYRPPILPAATESILDANTRHVRNPPPPPPTIRFKARIRANARTEPPKTGVHRKNLPSLAIENASPQELEAWFQL